MGEAKLLGFFHLPFAICHSGWVFILLEPQNPEITRGTHQLVDDLHVPD
jgi:hypothetical protein